MKKRAKFTVLMTLLCGTFFTLSCSSDWVAKINGDKISKKDFNNLYYAQIRSFYANKSNEEIDKLATDKQEVRRLPMLDRKIFLDQLVRQSLVYTHAVNEGITKNEELQLLMKMQEKAAVVTIFTQKKFQDKVNVTDEEVSKYYNKQKRNFKGQPISKVETYIKRQLTMQKFQKEAKDYIDDLKEKSSIEKNNEIIGKLSEIDKSKRPTSGWVAKVNGETITVENFEKVYYTQHEQLYKSKKDEIDNFASDPAAVKRNPLLNKSNFLEQEISQILVYNAAKDEKLLEDNDVTSLMKMQKEGLTVGYYLKDKYKDEIRATEEEIGAVYAREKDRFKGVSVSKAELYISQQIQEQKLKQKYSELMSSLIEKSIIEKNLDAMKINSETKTK